MLGEERPSGVVDVHQHHGHVAHSPAGAAGPGGLDAEIAARRQAMASLGVTHAVVLPGNSYLRPRGLADTREVNDGIRAYCDRDPGRYVAGAGVVEPLYGAAGLPEIRRLAELGLIGISYHARFQGVAANDGWILRHLEVMAELGLVPFVHSYADSALEAPLLIADLARAHPQLPIVVLDGFSSYHHALECIALAERHDNVVFDTAMAFNPLALVQFAAAVGAHRLLFGSDIYSRPHTFVTANTPSALRAAGFDADQLTGILGGNARRLLPIG